MTMLPFKQDATLTTEETVIREWLTRNRETLADKSLQEVSYLAVLCGFDVTDVCFALSSFRDALQGSQLGNRAAFHTWMVDQAIQDFQRLKTPKAKELDLSEQWKAITAYTTTGEER